MAKKFMYLSLGILALSTAYHTWARRERRRRVLDSPVTLEGSTWGSIKGTFR